jgi:hypothetical protein
VDGAVAATQHVVPFGNIRYTHPVFRVGRGFNGVLDEVGMWTSALPQDRIVSLYEMNSDERSVREHVRGDSYFSPCFRYLADHPEATDGVYSIAVGGASPLPIFCDMTNGGWTLLFKKTSGLSVSATVDTLWSNASLNENTQSILTRGTSAQDYASRLIRVIGSYDHARVELVTGGVAVKSLVFDVANANPLSWFGPTRYRSALSNAWSDLPTDASWEGTSGRFFSLRGGISTGTARRTFFLSESTSCVSSTSNSGWMLITPTSGSCSAIDNPANTVRYTPGSSRAAASTYVTANSLMVFVR